MRLPKKIDGRLLVFCVLARCKHLTHVVIAQEDENTFDRAKYPACHAYPRGIPLEIRRGIDRHEERRPDQDGDWVYERAKKRVDIRPQQTVMVPRGEITAT